METAFYQVMKWVFEDNPHFFMAVILNAAILFGINKRVSNKQDRIWDRLNKLEAEQSDQHRRLETHAGHFDVIRDDVNTAKDQSHRAVMLSYDAVRNTISRD